MVFAQQRNFENRLTTVTNTATSPNAISRFIYDGEGSRVMQINISGTQVMTTAYAGSIEVQITATQRITKSYYSAGSQLVAMRVITSNGSVLYFLSSDHLGSVSLTTDATGVFVARQKFDAWGNVRSAASSGSMQTDISFTGQRADAGINLLYFKARYYSPYLNRWIQPDSIVPDPKNPQSYNRYSYVNNNPVKYKDPNGYCAATANKYTSEDECWKRWREMRGILGYEAAGLESWGWGELIDLVGWINRGVVFSGGSWTGTTLGIVRDALNRVDTALGNKAMGVLGLKSGHLFFENGKQGCSSYICTFSENTIGGDFNGLYNSWNQDSEGAIQDTIHEIGHTVEMRAAPGGFASSINWARVSGWYQDEKGVWRLSSAGQDDAASEYSWIYPWEDFAETFTYAIQKANGLGFFRQLDKDGPSPARLSALDVAVNVLK